MQRLALPPKPRPQLNTGSLHSVSGGEGRSLLSHDGHIFRAPELRENKFLPEWFSLIETLRFLIFQV